MAAELIIYCDESESKGRHYSNFYGGALVSSTDIDSVMASIAAKKAAENLKGEIKWSKITPNYCTKYINMINLFFDLIKAGKIKVRIMFTQNIVRPRGLSREHYRNQYAILYYYFVRHAFGLTYSPKQKEGTKIRLYPDTLPLSAEECEKFKEYVLKLNNRTEFKAAGIRFTKEDITEVISHDHDVLQCLDIVLGAMNFRLNDKYKDKLPGQRRRSAKTLAKHRVYRQINKRIREIYPNFNIGITTGHQGNKANRWHHPYRHWNFRARNSAMVGAGKGKK